LTDPATTARRAPRAARILVATMLTLSLVGSGTIAAAAPGGSTGPSAPTAGGETESALRIQAQELAGEIQVEGQNLNRLAEAFDAATIRSQQLGAQLNVLRRKMVQTDAQVAAARAELKAQALLAYLAGGAPLITYIPDRPGSDPALTVSYAEIVAHGQQRAVRAYRTVLATQTRQSATLARARVEANVTLSELRADRAGAQAVLAQRQQTLASVTGRLAIVVASVQRAQQQAEQAAVRSQLSQRNDLPPPGPALTSASTHSRSVAATSPSTASHGPTTRRATTTTTRRVPVTTRPVPPTTRPPVTTPPTTVAPHPPQGNHPTPGWSTAVHYAYAQLGKPYQWGGSGPKSFDCSGLTMMAWAAAGWSLPHWAQGQYDMTEHIPISDALPGDLIFFGTPDNVGHVGIYIGGGQMIDAPSTGQDVSISSIYWSDLLGPGRLVG
jgi:cell wall-associated NlpC family hydrolase